MVGKCTDGSGRPSKGIHTLDEDMRNSYSFVLACHFDTSIDVDMAEIYCLPMFGTPIISISITDSVNQRFGREDLSGLLLVPTGRVPGEFRRCGAFESLYSKGAPLRKSLMEFTAEAEGSGLPFEKGEDSNEFIITII